MNFSIKVLFIFLSVFLLCNAISLKQVEQDIAAVRGINTAILGPVISAYVNTALQKENFTFVSSPQFQLTSSKLEVSGVLNIWSVPVQTSLIFTNATGPLEMTLSFAVNSTIIGGIKGIFEHVAPAQYKPELSELVISGGTISVALKTFGKDSGLTLAASIDLSSTGIYGEILVDLIKNTFKNPLSLHFYFPITDGGNSLQSVVSHSPFGAFGAIHFTYTLPGTYKIASDIYANDITITVNIGGSDSFSVTANLVVVAKNQNVTFASSGTIQIGQPITFTGQLVSAWNKPFGLDWIDLTSGTITVTISENPEISIIGTGPLTFAPTTNVKIGFAIGVEGFVASLTGVPVGDLPTFFTAVSGGKVPAEANQLAVKGTAGITVASFNDGSFQEGLTLQGTVVISTPGDMLDAQKELQPSATAGSTDFDFTLFVPIFTPEMPVVFTLSYTDEFPLHTGLQCTNFRLVVTVGTSNSISISANFAVQPAKNPTPVTFSLSGVFQSGDVVLSGDLTSPWNDAFGAKWLSITTATATLNLGKVVNALNIDAAGTLTFNNQIDKIDLQLQSGDDFAQYCFSANVDNLWNVSVIVETITGKKLPIADDFKGEDNVDYTFALCNYDGGQSPDGVTLGVSGVILGALEKRVHYISPGQIPTLIFDSTLYLPIFSADPTAFKFYLDVKDPIKVKPDLIFTQLILNIDGGVDGEISTQVDFTANLHKNPGPIYFDLKGVITDKGAITLTGFETGKWNDIFGIKGFDLSDVDAELAISPTACTVTGCVSDLGIGFTTVIGTKTVKFAGNAASPDFIDTFIEGSVQAANGSLILSVRDLAIDWNRMVPAHKIDVADVPSDMGLTKAFISLAGQSGTFGSYTYQEGFHISAQLNILQILCNADVNCEVSGLAPTCDFNIDVDIDFNAFLNELKKYVHIFIEEKYPQIPPKEIFSVWSLKQVGMSEFKTSLLSQGTNPLWGISIEVFGHTYNLNFRAALQEIHGSFENFFNKYIKHIF